MNKQWCVRQSRNPPNIQSQLDAGGVFTSVSGLSSLRNSCHGQDPVALQVRGVQVETIMKPEGNSQQRGRTRSTVSNATTLRPAAGVRLVNKHEAADILGISPETLKKYRLQKDSPLLKGIHYHVWNARVVRYNADLLADWAVHRNDPASHQKAIEAYLSSLACNQVAKRGRKSR